jgi:pimeloyl-[acyl-carrier protein] methyl ester esterase
MMLNMLRREGAGPPLVLVHGWTCDHTTMLPVADALPGRAAVLPDLLGHGASPRADDYAIARQAEAVLAVAPRRAIWIGHSMGAQVAVEAAVRAPGRVAALVLLDPAQITPTEAALAFRDRMAADLTRDDLAAVLRAFSRSMIVKATSPAAVEALSELQARADPDATRKGWAAIWAWDGRTRLAAVTCPTLVITVEKTMNRLADIARLNRNVSTAQVTGSGHMLQYEVMDQVAPMLRRFLALNASVIEG